jgi:hypothetical protein
MVMTEFEHPRHGLCRRITVDPAREFVVGVDLGRSVDNSVVAILQYTRVGTSEFEVEEAESSNYATIVREKYVEHFDLRELQRIKLETSYDEIIQHIFNVMHTEPLIGAELVIDDTGVGRPIGDLIEAQTPLRPIRITSTGGQETNKISARRYHVPKIELVSTLSGLFATNRIRLAHDLPNLEILRRECQTFLRTYTSSGRAQYSAASGDHDDCVSALSLCCFWAQMKFSPHWSHRRGGDYATAFVHGMY